MGVSSTKHTNQKNQVTSEAIVDSNNTHYIFIDLIEKHKYEQIDSLSIDTIEELV